MQPFEFERARDPQGAVTAVAVSAQAKFLAGGTQGKRGHDGLRDNQ